MKRLSVLFLFYSFMIMNVLCMGQAQQESIYYHFIILHESMREFHPRKHDLLSQYFILLTLLFFLLCVLFRKHVCCV